MVEHRLLFVPRQTTNYTQAAAPNILPVLVNGTLTGNAVYADFAYHFYVDESVKRSLDEGRVDARFVFAHPLYGESFEAREGAELIRIHIDHTPEQPAPQSNTPPVIDDDSLLEL